MYFENSWQYLQENESNIETNGFCAFILAYSDSAIDFAIENATLRLGKSNFHQKIHFI